MAGQTTEAHTAFVAGGRQVGPPDFLQASRKAFNAIKAEFSCILNLCLPSTTLPRVQSLGVGLCGVCGPWYVGALGHSCSPGLAVKEILTSC